MSWAETRGTAAAVRVTAAVAVVATAEVETAAERAVAVAEEVVAAVAWARQAGANGAAGKEAAGRARQSSPSPLPGGWQIESATNRCEEEQQHHLCREPVTTTTGAWSHLTPT